MKYINHLVDELEKKGISMQGCDAGEVRIFEKMAFEFNLPEAYFEFIKQMGKGTKNQFMSGESCYLEDIGYLKEGATELLKENGSRMILDNKDYVFWMSQGCMFCFFKLTEGDNPPVYFYNEDGEDAFIKIAKTLTEFFINRLEMKQNLFKSVD